MRVQTLRPTHLLEDAALLPVPEACSLDRTPEAPAVMATLAVLRQVTGEDLFDRTRRRGGRHGSALGGPISVAGANVGKGRVSRCKRGERCRPEPTRATNNG